MTAETRLRIMRSIKSKDTMPELRVRRVLFKMGFRYRLHIRDLPGCPDIVFRRLHKAIQVHGCFFHLHYRCPLVRIPKSAYWLQKLNGNKARDRRTLDELKRLGWKILIIWECETSRGARLEARLSRFLAHSRGSKA